MKHEDAAMGADDFANNGEVTFALGAVLRTLQQHISEGEMEDVLSVLPKNLRKYLQEAMDTSAPEKRGSYHPTLICIKHRPQALKHLPRKAGVCFYGV